jgi:hypothetical protein
VLQWSFYETKEDLARLMRDLNVNDIREKALYPELKRYYDNIPYADLCDKEKKQKKEREERQRRAEVRRDRFMCSRAEPTEEEEEEEEEEKEEEEEEGGGGGQPADKRDEGNKGNGGDANEAKEAGSKRQDPMDVHPRVSLEQVGSRLAPLCRVRELIHQFGYV